MPSLLGSGQAERKRVAGGSFGSWEAARSGGRAFGASVMALITLGGPPGTPPYMTGLNGKSFTLALSPPPPVTRRCKFSG